MLSKKNLKFVTLLEDGAFVTEFHPLHHLQLNLSLLNKDFDSHLINLLILIEFKVILTMNVQNLWNQITESII